MNLPVAEIKTLLDGLATNLCNSMESGDREKVLLVTSSGLLIAVGVVRDVFFNIDAELKLHGYDQPLLIR